MHHRIRVPYSGSGRFSKALVPCLEFAAEEANVDVRTAALVMSAFLEKVADEMCRGKALMIPGFGAFGVHMDRTYPTLRRNPERPNGVPRPRFQPSAALEQQVRASAVDCSQATEYLNSYRNNAQLKHRHDGMPKHSQRVFKTQEKFRERIRKQMEEEP